jgi:hypothetical protein
VKINNLDTCCEQVEEGRTANITVDVKSGSLFLSLRTYVFTVPRSHCHVQCCSVQVIKHRVLTDGLLVLWPNFRCFLD